MKAWLILILLALCAPAIADDKMQHGDWSSQFLESMGEASTHQDGSSVFGMLCASGTCRYYFANGIDCEPGSNYPIMLTTQAGARAIEAICEPMRTANGDVLLYWFGESPQLNAAFAQSAAIGFAFPMVDGQFRTSLFSMRGYSEAIERMIDGVRARSNVASPDEPGRT